MTLRWIWLGLVVGAAASAAAQGAPEPAREVLFTPVKLDGPVHDPAKHTYWFGPFAECSSVLDINGDGKLDVAAGRNYYLAPGWTKFSDYRDGAATNGPDIDDNFEGSMDVNNDGRRRTEARAVARRTPSFSRGMGGERENRLHLVATREPPAASQRLSADAEVTVGRPFGERSEVKSTRRPGRRARVVLYDGADCPGPRGPGLHLSESVSAISAFSA